MGTQKNGEYGADQIQILEGWKLYVKTRNVHW